MTEKEQAVLKAARLVCKLDQECRETDGEQKKSAQKARTAAIKTLATALKALDAVAGELGR